MMIRVPEIAYEDIHHAKSVSNTYFEFMVELKEVMQDPTYLWIYKSGVPSQKRHEQLLDFYYDKLTIEIMPDLVSFEEAIILMMQGYVVQRFDDSSANGPAEQFFYNRTNGKVYRENVATGTYKRVYIFDWYKWKFIKLGELTITNYIMED